MRNAGGLIGHPQSANGRHEDPRGRSKCWRLSGEARITAAEKVMGPIRELRAATEDDVIAALEGASFANWPQDEAELLEFFNRMIDVRLGETAGDGRMWPGLRPLKH